MEVAARLDELASLLREQEASSFRVGAYTRAAAVVRALPESVQDLYAREGLDGLERLPGVGPVISRAIRELVLTGRIPMLERLRGQRDAGRLLETVPGIGQRLAQRLREEHGLETLEDLEAAAHDGTLAGVAGFGTKRIRGIQEALAWRLGRARRLSASGDDDLPAVAELLDVDREYREKAAAGLLRRIAPRRFNPTGEAWLPVLHTQRGSRHYTALFSNTAQAHRLGRTADWVVLFYDGSDGERQATVVTARTGPRKGERVIRTTSGREGL
ncbi:MAG TPA: helix-hairpin-helix domain-containing protein [Gemmatimonadaceae bacterium]|nr:helix-hairpin-helix domain-containing protein [Gemmatimonadaceae bacterium]